MKRTIFFDMDNTIAALYDIPNWLPKLRANDPSPYAEAEVMINMSYLARLLHKVQTLGYEIGIISWLSKTSTPTYDEAVTAAKMAWLNQHLPSVTFNEIHIVAYGTPKSSFMKTPSDILFDDEEKNRQEWKGEAYSPSDIVPILQSLSKAVV